MYQKRLSTYEGLLPELIDGWDLIGWPHPDARAGMRVNRIWRQIGEDQLMLHRFTREDGKQEPHAHPMCVAAHVLGPGEYEVGFVVNGVCQARLVSNSDFYYEMITPEVRHYVLPRTDPIYSVAIWTPYKDEPAALIPGN